MSLFPHILSHSEAPTAANEDFRASLHADTIVVLDDTTNHFYETMSNSKDLQELRADIGANDNSVEELNIAA